MYKPEPHVAFHEAGHVAAILIFDQGIESATSAPDISNRASASHLGGNDLTEKGMREMVINCYAGREAGMRVGGDGSGSWDDDEQAEGYLKHVGGEEEMRKETAYFVTEHWSLIERIAKELLEHTTLEMGELETLLNIYRGDETDEDLREYRHSLNSFNEAK